MVWYFVPYAGVTTKVYLSIDSHAVASNDSEICYGSHVRLVCYYPNVLDVVEGEMVYETTTPFWKENSSVFSISKPTFSVSRINTTAYALDILVNKAYFMDSSRYYSCFLFLNDGHYTEDRSTDIEIHPLGTCVHLFIQ